jgi:hypothetical protein
MATAPPGKIRSMRTTTDALRSLARYCGEAFGEDWNVDLWSAQGTFTRPAIAVRTTGPTLLGGPRHTVDLTQPVALYVYPPNCGTGEATFAAAAAADDLLFTAFRVGIGAGRPMRVPLYDYAGVGLDEPSAARAYPDFLRVLDFSIDRQQSPDDENLWTLIAEMRVGWRRMGEQPDSNATQLVEALKFKALGL